MSTISSISLFDTNHSTHSHFVYIVCCVVAGVSLCTDSHRPDLITRWSANTWEPEGTVFSYWVHCV